MNEEFYKFNYNQINGEEVSLNKFKGKVILIVNTASNCGLTYHYTGLENLYKEYKDKGLVIIGFPCNQFGRQEPGTSEEIQEFCDLNYNVTFPLSEKIEVNGSGAHPLYKYLKKKLVGKLNNNIKWNFTKFLVDKNGNPSKRFASVVDPEDIKSFIDDLI